MALTIALITSVFAVVLIGVVLQFTRPRPRSASNVCVRAHDAHMRLQVARSKSQIRAISAKMHRKLVRNLSALNLPAENNRDSSAQPGPS